MKVTIPATMRVISIYGIVDNSRDALSKRDIGMALHPGNTNESVEVKEVVANPSLVMVFLTKNLMCAIPVSLQVGTRNRVGRTWV